jgi:hypothetical protein
LKSLQWNQLVSIEYLIAEIRSRIESNESVESVDFAKNRKFLMCKLMVKSLSSMDFDCYSWDAKVSDWRHSLLDYKPHKAVDYLSYFIESNLQIIDPLLWLKKNLPGIKAYHSSLQWKYTTELDMYKEEWEKLFNLPINKIIGLALHQIELRRMTARQRR